MQSNTKKHNKNARFHPHGKPMGLSTQIFYIPEKATRMAKHLAEQLEPTIDSVPVFVNQQNGKWKRRLIDGVLPICRKVLKEQRKNDFETFCSVGGGRI